MSPKYFKFEISPRGTRQKLEVLTIARHVEELGISKLVQQKCSYENRGELSARSIVWNAKSKILVLSPSCH